MKDSDFGLTPFCWGSSGPRPSLLSGMLKSPNQDDPVLSPKYPRLLVLEHNLEINSCLFLLMHHSLMDILLMAFQLFALSQETGIQSFPDKGQSLLMINFDLDQKLADVFYKRPDSKYFRFCRPRGLCGNLSTLPLECGSSHRQDVNG